MVRSTVGRLIRIQLSILAVALACGLSLYAALAGGASSADIGRKERTESGTVVLRAGTRPPLSLIYRSKNPQLGRVLGVAWDGRIWYARVDEEEEEKADGLEWHHTWSIELISPKGMARRVASFPRDTRCFGGSLSPDARYLAYALQADLAGKDQSRARPVSVLVMGSDGSGKRRLTTFPDYGGEAPRWVYAVSWSPDSTRLAIPIRSEGRNRIALVSAADGRVEYLPTPDWADATCPDWSPDGRSVAYSCEDRGWKPEKGEGTDWTSFRWFVWLDSGQTEAGEAAEAREQRKDIRPAAIWVTDLRSRKSRRVTKTPSTDTVDLLPRWSPGGTQIAYARWEWGHEFDDMHYWWLDLRVVEANGTKDRMIEDPTEKSEWGAVPASAAEGDMGWLPDGRRVAFRGCQEGGEGRATGLAMVRVDGTQT